MTGNTLRDLDEGDYVHSEKTGDVYEVEDIDIRFEEDELPSGSVTFSDGRSVFTRSAEEVDYDLHYQTLAVVNETIINNAENILLEFAEQELKKYLQRLGVNHDYNGIGNVDTLRDLKAAESLHGERGE